MPRRLAASCWEELSLEELTEAFGDAAFAADALTTWAEFVRRPDVVTTTVQDVTGAPALTFEQWAADHAEDLR